MAYKRKTKDVWYILVNYGYGHGWEHECTEESWADAKAQLKCYRENCPQYPVRARKARERIVDSTANRGPALPVVMAAIEKIRPHIPRIFEQEGL
jgi:hypothetical protein